MHRRALLAATATTAVSGCVGSAASDPSPGEADPNSPVGAGPAAAHSGWKATVEGDGDALARSPSDLYFRVNGCSDAAAARTYSVESDEATISFDYEVAAEGWWERPYLRIYDSGEKIYDSGDDPVRNIARTEYGTTTGTFETTVSTSGTITVEFGLERSRHCENGDHANTYFRVNGVTVSAGRPGWQTNRAGNGAALARDGATVDLRVYRCARASAIKRIDASDEDVTVSFDYEVTAEGWWERPYVRIYDAEGKLYDSGDDDTRGIERSDHATTTGTFRVTVASTSDIAAVLGLEPSRHCGNGDHANTHFRIANFAVE